MIYIKYVGSKSRIAKHIVPIIQSYIDNTSAKFYLEPFCLSKDTTVYTETGTKTISEIEVGDKIIDDHGQLQTVISKIRSPETKGYKAKLNGGIEITATKDHVFYTSNGEEVTLNNSLDQYLLIGNAENADSMPCLDMNEYITTSNMRGGRNGKLIGNDNIKLYHNAPVTNRYIPVNYELMWCYGLTVAEGDPHNITLNNKEFDIAKRFIDYYAQVIGINLDDQKKFYLHPSKKVLQVAIPYPTIYKKIFFDAMNIGYGARNKNLSFLFQVSPALVKVAICAFLIGDGCIKKSGNGNMIQFKTSSKMLAKQLQVLLATKLHIKSNLYHGINKERIIEGRQISETDYYTISINKQEDIDWLLFDIPNKTENKNLFKVISVKPCVDEFFDIRLENGSTHKFILDGGIVTHNCGGANVIDKISCDRKIGYDINHYLIELFKNRDRIAFLPDEITQEEYAAVRKSYQMQDGKYPDWYIGAVGFLASYNGKFFGGRAGIVKTKIGTYRNYYDEAKRNILAQLPNLQDVEFVEADYRTLDLDRFRGGIIYCDIPYKGTTGYENEFDHDEFWKWAEKASETNIVLVSEQQAPENWKSIWSQPVKRTQRTCLF